MTTTRTEEAEEPRRAYEAREASQAHAYEAKPLAEPPRIVVQVCVRGQKPILFRFPRSEITIGRLPSNDLLLAHASVDERHARILVKDGRYIAVDFKSKGGTFVNRKAMTAPTVLRDVDVMSVGPYDINILLREPPGEREQRFLDMLDEYPDDDATRTVYSDWLEEEGRFDEAAFIRAQLTIRDLAPEHPQFHELAETIQRLGPKMGSSWRRTISRPPIERCPVRFELQCPKQWDQLRPTTDPNQRFCGSCKKYVHYAASVEEARVLAIEGNCVVVDLIQPRRKNDLDPPPPRIHYGGVIAPLR